MGKIYFRKIDNKWDENKVKNMDPVDRLVYRSNIIGSDPYINNTGGGNTSSKVMEKDPVTGESVEVLWVKGSGGDLRTAKSFNFASLYQQKLLKLQEVYADFDEKGPKTPAEDKMVSYYPHCTYNLNPRAPSIDTPLHSFIPFKYVDHTHPVPVIAIATADCGKELTKEIYGDEVAWVDWLRPGFELGLQLQNVIRKNPGIRGIVLGGHGLINWANDDKECYLTTLDLINKAADYLSKYDKGKNSFGGTKFQSIDPKKRDHVFTEILPFIRGQISQDKRLIGTIQYDGTILQFINSNDAQRLSELGTSCPDHFLRTKIKPLYVAWDPQHEDSSNLKEKISRGLEQYRQDYEKYYQQHRKDDSPAIRNPNPTIILVPGLGMIAWGKNKSESRVTAEFYNAAIGVMRGAESIAKYVALPKQEAFDIEYWSLEEAKLKRMPPEKELSRRIIAVFGAGSGIGKAAAHKIIDEGAMVAVLDLDSDAAEKTANEILEKVGMGIGVAGSGLSGSGDIIGLGCDITDRISIRNALEKILVAYGGLDDIIVTAGLYAIQSDDREKNDKNWDLSFAVNTKGSYIIADEVSRIWNDQGLDASMVITTSVNGVVAKKGSMAYDISKAAANHLIRELAIQYSPLIRINGVAPATVIEGSSMFPRERVIASLKKYHISFSESEEDDSLIEKLKEFYASRTLTRKPITPEHQVEAIFMLLSSHFENTTGHIIPVDAGIVEAFMR